MNTLGKALIGLLALGVIVSLVMLFNGSQPVGSENLIGMRLPDFAAPLASGTQNADANVYTPAQAEAAHSHPACAVELPGAFNSCRDLKGDAIVMFWNSTKGVCGDQVATLDGFLRNHRRVNAVAVAFDQPESDVRSYVKERGWKVPVAIDRDGAVAALYSVAGCPTTFFVSDGRITGVELGKLTSSQIARQSAASSATPGTGG